MGIRFNFPHQIGSELDYIKDSLTNGKLAGDGPYTHKCSQILEQYLGSPKVLLTHSCTAALEMAAILADVQPGDEVIMPSYTFVSTANAFVLRGAVPVFIDIRPDTLNIDESLIEAAITPKTKAIVPVHYAGVACEMDTILDIAAKHDLLVIEDAAQGLGSSYKGRKLGTLGDLAAISFHETKNIVSGEGGALAINNPAFHERAEIIREKGTNRSKFFRGEIDKYTWVDLGSSYLPSELVAAFLYGQLEKIDEINSKRIEIWNHYDKVIRPLEKQGLVSLTRHPEGCLHNAHMYYILTRTPQIQQAMLKALKNAGINAVFHYIPLHATEAGIKFGQTGSAMDVTDDAPWRLIRLPIYPDLERKELQFICETVRKEIKRLTNQD
nr:dTDP-4-amino-4,6-dideoxygalactose transaminase [uncultured Pseudodesulfovibrio sp.]